MMMMICVKYIKTSWKTTKNSVGNVGANEQVKKFTSKGISYDIIIISGAVIASFNAWSAWRLGSSFQTGTKTHNPQLVICISVPMCVRCHSKLGKNLDVLIRWSHWWLPWSSAHGRQNPDVPQFNEGKAQIHILHIQFWQSHMKEWCMSMYVPRSPDIE